MHKTRMGRLALNPVMLQRPLPLLGIGGVVVRALLFLLITLQPRVE